MGTVSFSFKQYDAKKVENAEFYQATKIEEKNFLTATKIKTVEFLEAKILDRKRTVNISQKLPFYVKFENVETASYGPAFPAPIGIAVIGFNNYIL